MNKPTVDANICIVDGPHYPVRLKWVPRVGEIINLYSLIDATAKDPDAFHSLEVEAVVHHLYDVSEKHPEGHFVTVFAQPSRSKFGKAAGL
jgi:hypothetical protein